VPLTNLFNKETDGRDIYRLGPPRSAIYELPAKGGPQGGAFVSVGKRRPSLGGRAFAAQE